MTLLRFVALRLLQAVPVLAGVSVVTFALMLATPGDPVRLLAGPRASEAAIAAIRARYGLDEPVLSQSLAYLGTSCGATWASRCAAGRPWAT